MATGKRYYLVDAEMLPEIFLKVMQVKELTETGECRTITEATARVGISRSAFYKYRDAISDFRDRRQERIVTFHVQLRDGAGRLSTLLNIFAESGANILTINQSLPSNGAALVVISVDVENAPTGSGDLLLRIREMQGVIWAEILAG